MYVLDTNSVVYFFRGEGQVGRRFLTERPAEIGLPAIVVYELEVGALRSKAPERRREQLDTLLDAVAVLPFGPAEARAAATLRVELERSGQGIGPLDTLIAATALVNGATLVTHNTREFRRVRGLRTEDWY